MSSITESNKRRAIDGLSVSTSAVGTATSNVAIDTTSSVPASSSAIAPPIPSSTGNSPRVPRLKPAAPSIANAWSRPLAAESLRSQSDVAPSVKPVKPPVPQRKMTPITETKASESKQPIVPAAPSVDARELERRAHAAGVWRDAIHPSTLRSESKNGSAGTTKPSSSSSSATKSESASVKSTEEEVPIKGNSNQFTDERRNCWELAKRACNEAIVRRITSSGGTQAMMNRLRASAIRENERLKTLRAGMKPFYGVNENANRTHSEERKPMMSRGGHSRLMIEVRIVNACASAEGYGLINRRFMTQSDGKRTFGELRQSLEREFQNIADRYCNSHGLAGARPRVELIETILPTTDDFFIRARAGSRTIPNTLLDSAMATTDWSSTDPRAPWQLLEAVVRVTDTGMHEKEPHSSCVRERAHVIRRRAWVSTSAHKEASPSLSPSSSPTRRRNKLVFDHDSRAANLFPAANS